MDETCEKLRYGRYSRISSCSSRRSRCLFKEVSNSINGESTATSQRLPLFYRLIVLLRKSLFGHQCSTFSAVPVPRFPQFRQRKRTPQVEEPRTAYGVPAVRMGTMNEVIGELSRRKGKNLSAKAKELGM